MKRNQESRRLSPPKNGSSPEAPAALLNRQGQTPLQNACLHGELQMIKSLLEDGVDINHEDWLGNTALMYAVRANLPAVVELLLSSSDIDVCKKYGVRTIQDTSATALIYAVTKRLVDIVYLLSEKKECVDKRDCKGRTPLFYALIRGYPECVSILLNAGAIHDDIIDFKNKNAIRIAIGKGESSAIKELLKYASIDVESQLYEDLIIHACYLLDMEMITLLLDRYGLQDARCKETGNSPIMIAYKLESYDIVERLIKAADTKALDSKNSSGETMLHMACGKRDYGILWLLLVKGAVPNVQDEDGNTPLMIACMISDVKITETLLEYNAEVNTQNSYGLSALMICLEKGCKECLNAVLKAHPEPGLMDNSGRMAIDYAKDVEIKGILNEYLMSYSQDSISERVKRDSKKVKSFLGNIKAMNSFL
jgi:ankyrin repeat protein